MRESQQVLEWQPEARVKEKIAAILTALEVRLNGPVPKDIAEAINAETNGPRLGDWFRHALKTKSYDEFRTALQP